MKGCSILLKIFFTIVFNFLSDNITLITALILLATLILAFRKSKIERITLRIQTLYSLQNEYRLLAIKEAKRQIIHHYHDICNEDREAWIHHYFKLLKTINELDKL
jgi:predicted membrane protein